MWCLCFSQAIVICAIGKEKNDAHFRILESLCILKLKPSLNDMHSAFPLKIAVYKYLFYAQAILHRYVEIIFIIVPFVLIADDVKCFTKCPNKVYTTI